MNNNKGYSEAIKTVSDSVVMIIKRPVTPEDTVNMDAIYLDSQNLSWTKGTGFAVTEDGWIVTAKHVIDNANDIQVISYKNGQEETHSVQYVSKDNLLDLAIVKINKTTKPVKIYYGGEKLPEGYKIGFIGFPSDEKGAKIAHDGTISYAEYGKSGFPVYNVHAFVNSGHSGGPVFLADTGEVIGFVTSRIRASNLPVAEYSSNKKIEINSLPQDQPALILLAQIFNQQSDMYNRQSEMYNILRTEVSDKTQMGVGIVIGINKATVDDMLNEGRKNLIKRSG